MKIEIAVCSYCGSALHLTKEGRCMYCSGPYMPIITAIEEQLIITKDSELVKRTERPTIGVIPEPIMYENDLLNQFFSEIIEYKMTGMIYGGAKTGKTEMLLSVLKNIDETERPVVFSRDLHTFKHFIRREDIKTTIRLADFDATNSVDFSKYSIVLFDDFSMLPYLEGLNRSVVNFPKIASRYLEIVNKIESFEIPLIITTHNKMATLMYHCKYVLGVKSNNDGTRTITFDAIPGRKPEDIIVGRREPKQVLAGEEYVWN